MGQPAHDSTARRDRLAPDGAARDSGASGLLAPPPELLGGIVATEDTWGVRGTPLPRPIEAAGESLVVVADRSEARQQESRAELFYQAFLHSHDAIELTDREGVLVDVNPAFERIYGYRRDELIGKRPKIVRSPKNPPEMYRDLWNDILDPKKGRWSREILNLDRQGREHTVLLTIDAVRNSQGEITHFLGVATDVSEQRAAQLQAVRYERLVSLGQLAAGVAHEVNTPLANVQLIAESLARRSNDAWIQERAASILRQVDAAATIVRGLLDFARNHPADLVETDVTRIAHDALEFLQGKRWVDVEVIEEHDAPPLLVRANRVQLLQVLVNLINNAYDAMEGHGRLTLRTRCVDHHAEIAVTDTGPGISDQVLPHLFEPFFTTKAVGAGTGLGLSTCHGIARAHGGEILVRSELGHGATFTVRLPLEGPNPSLPPPESGPPATA